MDSGAKFLCKKILTASDVGAQCKFIIHREHILNRFGIFWTKDWIDEVIQENIPLTVYDRDEGRVRDEKFVLKYQTSCKTYVFQKDWREFVRRKELKNGDTVSFWWNIFEKQLEIKCVKTPAPPSKIYFSACFNLFLHRFIVILLRHE